MSITTAIHCANRPNTKKGLIYQAYSSRIQMTKVASKLAVVAQREKMQALETLI